MILGRVIIIARRNSVTVQFEGGEKLKHGLDFLDLRLLINGRVGGDLVSKNLGHLDCFNGFLENSFALDNQIMSVFQAIDMDIPIHPLGGCDDRAVVAFALANRFGVFLSYQASPQ